MSSLHKNIAIVESSDILYEGLSIIILKTGNHYHLYRYTDLEELNVAFVKNQFDFIFVGLSQVVNRIKLLKSLKKNVDSVSWIGIDHGTFNQECFSLFNEIIFTSDSSEMIVHKLNKATFVVEDEFAICKQDELSEREIEVLSLIVKGFSNKEIAEKLIISVHTVVTHRKNIIQKTGIKSQAGLTIYAISQKIISVDGFLI